MVLGVGGSNVVEEDRLLGRFKKYPSMVGENSHLDDASSAPHTSNTSVIQIPVELQEGE